jgi:hypothetical protein
MDFEPRRTLPPPAPIDPLLIQRPIPLGARVGSYGVIVDAGNSTVLHTHVEGGHHGGDKGHRADDATDAAASSATTG